MKISVRRAVAVLFIARAVSAQAPSHFSFVGPLADIMGKGVSAAPVSRGLGFDMTFTEFWPAAIAVPPFSLTVPGADKPLVLTIDQLRFAAGHLQGKAALPNATSSPLEGVRLDIVSVTETYTADSMGHPVIRSRALSAGLPSALYFGDIAAGQDNGVLPFDVGAITTSAATKQITIHGVVSGVRYVDQIAVPDMNGTTLGVDAQGRVYVGGGELVKRVSADRKSVETFVSETANNGVAVDPATQDVLTVSQNKLLTRYGTDGTKKNAWDAEERNLDFLTLGVRVAKDGRLCSSADNQRNLQCLTPQGRKQWSTFNPGNVSLFDIASDGTIYAAADSAVVTLDAKGALKPFLIGSDYRPGRIYAPVSVAIGPTDGLVYVLEEERKADDANNVAGEAARVSVFDRNGRFVRTWGRGASALRPRGTTAGLIVEPTDIVFGANGLVHVLTKLQQVDISRVLMTFQIF